MQGEKLMLAYTQLGNAESETTLVFLHGSTMTKEGLLPFAAGFSNYNCVVFDLTAHGESAGKEPSEIKTFAEDVEYSVTQLQEQKIIGARVVLLGYSMGGAITCEIAIRNKMPLVGMVLLSSGADLNNHTPLVDGLKNMPAEKFNTSDIYAALFGTDTPEAVQKAIIASMDSTKVADAIGYGDLIASNQYNRLSDSKDIEIPALLVHGNDDKIVLPTAAIETWKAIPNSQLLMVPYKGHALIIEDMELVKQKVLSFIEKI